jgi:outer membrane protein assembly factor BamB
VLAADRSVNAFDGQTGRKLWAQQRPNEPLVLRQSGVMLAVGDTLVVGLGGRLAGPEPFQRQHSLGGARRHAARHQ